MVNRPYAVIDLGSNTFHLLIFEPISEKPFHKVLFRERQLVYLAESGVDEINDKAFARGLRCMEIFKRYCNQYGVVEIKAVGTSALRNAHNAGQFVNTVKHQTGIAIEIVSGDQEAQWIFNGQMMLPIDNNAHLIIDIGGGSVEFILFEDKKIVDKISVTMGISHLRHTLILKHPPSISEVEGIFEIFDNLIGDFKNKVKSYQVQSLIGASGPFEIIESIFTGDVSRVAQTFNKDQVSQLADKIITSDLLQRQSIKGMPRHRADLSLESFLIIKYCLSSFVSIKNIVISPYSMKEGIIADWKI